MSKPTTRGVEVEGGSGDVCPDRRCVSAQEECLSRGVCLPRGVSTQGEEGICSMGGVSGQTPPPSKWLLLR